jgi:hypothetical protein
MARPISVTWDERFALAGRDQRLAQDGGRGAEDVRDRPQTRRFLVILGDASLGHSPHVDVCRRSDDAVAKLSLEPGHQGEGQHEGRDADRDAQRRHRRDQGDEGLLAPGEEIAERDEQRHDRPLVRQRVCP